MGAHSDLNGSVAVADSGPVVPRAALHWLVAMGGGVVLQILLGWSLRATPLLSEGGANTLYDPSAALTLVTVVLGYFAVDRREGIEAS